MAVMHIGLDPPVTMCPPQSLVFILVGLTFFMRSTCGMGMSEHHDLLAAAKFALDAMGMEWVSVRMTRRYTIFLLHTTRKHGPVQALEPV